MENDLTKYLKESYILPIIPLSERFHKYCQAGLVLATVSINGLKLYYIIILYYII